MRLKGILITLVVLLAIIFAVTNWQVLMTYQTFNVLFFQVFAPLSMILLWTAVGLSFLFFLLALLDRATQLRQITHLEGELERLHKRLEQKRLTELEALEARLDGHMDAIEEKLGGVADAMQSRLGDQQQALREELREHAGRLEERVLLVRNELAADIAQMEDNLREPHALRQLGSGSDA